MELPDIIDSLDSRYFDFMHKLGIGEIYKIENGMLNRQEHSTFPFKVETEKFENTIIKGRANAIAFWEKDELKLDKGLCEKMKENEMFIIFDLRNIKDWGKFRTMHRNAILANDYGVYAIFASFASKKEEILSAYQIMSIAETLGYRYENLRRSYKRLLELS